MKRLLILSLAVNVFLLGSSFTPSDCSKCNQLYNVLFDMREYLTQDIEACTDEPMCASKLESYVTLVDYALDDVNRYRVYQPEYNHAVSLELCSVVSDTTQRNIHAIWFKGQCFTRNLEAEGNE